MLAFACVLASEKCHKLEMHVQAYGGMSRGCYPRPPRDTIVSMPRLAPVRTWRCPASMSLLCSQLAANVQMLQHQLL
jgi:hypothetical protein